MAHFKNILHFHWTSHTKHALLYLLSKTYKHGVLGCPIDLGCNFPAESFSALVYESLQHIVVKLLSFIHDTNHFLCYLQELPKLLHYIPLVTMNPLHSLSYRLEIQYLNIFYLKDQQIPSPPPTFWLSMSLPWITNLLKNSIYHQIVIWMHHSHVNLLMGQLE